MDAWRVVESQHQISTRKLVDSDAEQLLLEQLIERVKPPERTHGRLHYLLFTPFRYPPLRHGSRFGTRMEPAIWYGSEALRTAFAEVAYYRLLFLEGTSADLGVLQAELTTFRILVRTERGVDLTAAPFGAHRAVLASPIDYAETQALGRAMRAAGVQVFRYPSARAQAGGVNVGVFAPEAFGRRAPRALETWHSVATRERVEMVRRDYFKRGSYFFLRAEFLVNGTLPAPAF
ncbi:MAG TPA: RES family NAD+ phosphorylase [Longimicrobiales bacterium]